MKGLEIAMTVRMNQDGWVMIRDFKFFLSLRMKIEDVSLNFLKLICIKVFTLSIPSVDHLIALLEPANAGHLVPRCSSVHVYDQVILRHQHLQTAHHIPEEQVWRPHERVKRSQIRKSQNKEVVQSGLAGFAKSNNFNFLTGRGFPSGNGNLDSCCQEGNTPWTQWWRSSPRHSTLKNREEEVTSGHSRDYLLRQCWLWSMMHLHAIWRADRVVWPAYRSDVPVRRWSRSSINGRWHPSHPHLLHQRRCQQGVLWPRRRVCHLKAMDQWVEHIAT